MTSFIQLLKYTKPYRLWAFFATFSLSLVVVADLAIPRLTQTVIDKGIAAGNSEAIIKYSLMMLAFAGVGAIFSILNTLLAVRVSQYTGADIRSALIGKIQSLSFGNLDNLQTGQMLVRATSDITLVQNMIMMSLRMLFRAPLWIIGSLIMLGSNTPELLPLLGILMLIVMVFIATALFNVRSTFRAVQEKLDKLNQVLVENLSGIRVVKAFVQEKHEQSRFERVNLSLTETNIKVMKILSFIFPTMIMIINLGIAAALWKGGVGVVQGTFTLGEIVAAFNYLMLSLFPLMMLGGMLGPMASAEASASRILEVLNTEPEIKKISSEENSSDTMNEDIQKKPENSNIYSLSENICFKDVYFRYHGSSDDILKGISFTADSGKMLAILGSTGSGKSTLVNLIPRFYDATAGEVFIGNQNIKELEIDSLRKSISMVMQETILFSGTILDNIRFGKPDASMEEVKSAAAAACADEFIAGLPDGYNSIVGRMGINLSGGQKQRLAIARSLIVSPDILILDDSTSAVDVETESQIEKAIQEISLKREQNGQKPMTVIIVAQRISTVINANNIIVLDNGHISAKGTHDELMLNSPIYREIYESQLGGLK